MDLSGVQKDANALSSILSTKPISVDAAYVSAKGAQAGIDTNAAAMQALQASLGESVTNNFTQNNNSPRALSEAEIYRQTKSLVSRAKGA